MPAQTFRATRTNNRRHPGVRGRRPDRYQARVEEAQERAKERAGRTAAEQIGRLDAGGFVAARERVRLVDQIAGARAKKK